MRRKFVLSFLILVVAVGGFYIMLLHLTKKKPAPPSSPAAIAAVPAQPAPTVPTPRYPVATTMTVSGAPEELPNLQNSDTTILTALSAILKGKTVADYLSSEGFIRRLVATIDNLPRESIAVQLRPVKSVEGKFLVLNEDNAIVVSPKNAERYASYVEVLQGLDSKKLVALYVRFYPLFQQAYQDLGYPNGYFNDRLIAVIDHLLSCPDAPATLQLLQPHVAFQFADPDLEHMSAGDKILFRIGNANAKKVKQKLREIRAELAVKSAAIL